MPRWQRQRGAIEAFAKAAGYSIVAEFYVAAVSGADRAPEREDFAAMLERIAGNGVGANFVESPDRFAAPVGTCSHPESMNCFAPLWDSSE